MTLSYGVFYTLVVLCSIGIVVLLVFLLNKWASDKKTHVTQLLVYLILGVGLLTFYLLKSQYTPVIEISGFESKEYVLVFGSSFTASDEQVVHYDSKHGKVIVVNITGQTMFVEPIEYSIGGIINLSNESVTEVPAHTYRILEHEPDFYPWDGTPEEITVSGNALYAKKIRVHF